MKRILLALSLLASVLTACALGPVRRGYVGAPPLPATVVLGQDPYYYNDGYHYYYQRDRWSYAPSRNGPWQELPREHYPREVRYHGRPGPGDRGERTWSDGHRRD